MRLLTTREAAERLGVSTRSVQRLQERGTLPPVRLPGLRLTRFDPDDVEQLARKDSARPADGEQNILGEHALAGRVCLYCEREDRDDTRPFSRPDA